MLYEAGRGSFKAPGAVPVSQQTSAPPKRPWVDTESLPAAGLLSAHPARPLTSQRRSRVQPEASINTQPHQAVKDHTLDLIALQLDGLHARTCTHMHAHAHTCTHRHTQAHTSTHRHTHVQWQYFFNDIIKQNLLHSPVLWHLRESFIQEQCLLSLPACLTLCE